MIDIVSNLSFCTKKRPEQQAASRALLLKLLRFFLFFLSSLENSLSTMKYIHFWWPERAQKTHNFLHKIQLRQKNRFFVHFRNGRGKMTQLCPLKCSPHCRFWNLVCVYSMSRRTRKQYPKPHRKLAISSRIFHVSFKNYLLWNHTSDQLLVRVSAFLRTLRANNIWHSRVTYEKWPVQFWRTIKVGCTWSSHKTSLVWWEPYPEDICVFEFILCWNATCWWEEVKSFMFERLFPRRLIEILCNDDITV